VCRRSTAGMAVSNSDECSSFVFVVLCRLRPLRRADHSPRVVLGCVRVKSSAIFKSEKKGALGPRWAVLPPSFKNKIILIFTCTVRGKKKFYFNTIPPDTSTSLKTFSPKTFNYSLLRNFHVC
jgi:hypothetical protein